MGAIRQSPTDALLFFAIFSRSADLLDRTRHVLCERFGPLLVAGPRVSFTDTKYYERTMGLNLLKEWFGVKHVLCQSQLADVKRTCQELEETIPTSEDRTVARPLNIDPGMVDLGKVMLASTKNHAHRVYVGGGIFVEVTLYLCEGEWAGWPWTYPDYRRPEVHRFFDELREHYRLLRPAR